DGPPRPRAAPAAVSRRVSNPPPVLWAGLFVGVLAPVRAPGGQRRYPPGAVDRVRLIQQLYAAGLPSRTIAELMPCIETGEVTPALLDRLSAERDRIEERIGGLVDARDRLERLITTATGARDAGRRRPGWVCASPS
ncbi:MerR family transcriptional regulator, partial [Streptosporangium sp. NPDC048865]|uniref:MerR family transcriptional regulator n=1 Tax=Streptosporangium sp. NPDC048865 TaxID=3155766 RepID=UPI00343068D2